VCGHTVLGAAEETHRRSPPEDAHPELSPPICGTVVGRGVPGRRIVASAAGHARPCSASRCECRPDRTLCRPTIGLLVEVLGRRRNRDVVCIRGKSLGDVLPGLFLFAWSEPLGDHQRRCVRRAAPPPFFVIACGASLTPAMWQRRGTQKSRPVVVTSSRVRRRPELLLLFVRRRAR
jgi:hypothetical protein